MGKTSVLTQDRIQQVLELVEGSKESIHVREVSRLLGINHGSLIYLMNHYEEQFGHVEKVKIEGPSGKTTLMFLKWKGRHK